MDYFDYFKVIESMTSLLGIDLSKWELGRA
jgi:hypothetical protein